MDVKFKAKSEITLLSLKLKKEGTYEKIIGQRETRKEEKNNTSQLKNNFKK